MTRVQYAVGAVAGAGAQPWVVASGVQRHQGQRSSGAPPHSRPRIANFGSAGVSEVGEHWFGDDLPQPVQDGLDGTAVFLPFSERPLRVGRVRQCLQHSVRAIRGAIQGQAWQVDDAGVIGASSHDEGMAAVTAYIDDHYRSACGRRGQFRVRNGGEEVLEPGYSPNLRQDIVPIPGRMSAHVHIVGLVLGAVCGRRAITGRLRQGRHPAVEDGTGSFEAAGQFGSCRRQTG